MRFTAEQVAQLLGDKIQVIDDCWLWQRAKTHNGYGTGWFDGQLWRVHRYVYSLVGEIPEGAELDHLCRNRACCRPSHLEPVSRAENARRGVWPNAAKTHCPAGHSYDDAYLSRRGSRTCRPCALRRAAERKVRA